ncbi:MAG: type II toxin-antitoxin system VapC family toxin [Planctomycetota bacterium]
MKKSILIDTAVLVDYLREYSDAVAYVKAQAERIVLSCIVAAELYAGVRNGEELDRLDEFLTLFPVLPVTAEVARSAGLYNRDYGNSHGVGLADAIIAATAEAHAAEIKTLNIKHYPMLKDLKPPYVKK